VIINNNIKLNKTNSYYILLHRSNEINGFGTLLRDKNVNNNIILLFKILSQLPKIFWNSWSE